MAGKLEGKIALVTGGSSGIGLATAQGFVNEGAYVYITGRRQAELDKAVKTIGKQVTAVRADASDLSDLDKLFAQIKQEKGHLDVVFANAGGGSLALGLALSPRNTTTSIQSQRERATLYGAEGPAAYPRWRIDHPERIDRLDQGHAGIQRVLGNEGCRAFLRS